MRINGRLLPSVFPSHVKKGWGMKELDEKYEALPKELLRVTAHCVTPVILGDDGVIHLDSVIGSAVAAAHPCPFKHDCWDVFPMPLAILWQDDRGYPLWAATDLQPVGDKAVGREYWHKRYPADKAPFGKKQTANTTAGRWREYRVPVETVACERFEAACIGNREEVQRLLDHIGHIGKKTGAGYGKVAKWTVEPLHDEQPEMLVALNRPLPLEYARKNCIVGVRGRRGWTPPYWFAPNWTECVRP